MQETDCSSAEGLTPGLRHLSLPESERSPLRLKLGSLDAHLKHASMRSDSKWSWRQKLPFIVAFIFFAAAATAYISSTSSKGLLINLAIVVQQRVVIP